MLRAPLIQLKYTLKHWKSTFSYLFGVFFLCFCSESVRKVLRVCLRYRKDVLDWCLIDFDEILQVFDVEIPKPKEQVEQEHDVDRINE